MRRVRYARVVRVLKLCTSDDLAGDLADDARAYRVAERTIREATGEDVQTTLKAIWPDRALPDVVENWLVRYQPDLVLFVVSGYWMTFESVSLRLERRLGRLGRWLGRAGERAARIPGSESAAGRALRTGLRRVVGADAAFTPEEVISVVEACIRRVLSRESVGLVVRAPLVALVHNENARGRARGERRLAEVDAALQQLCSRLSVEYVTREAANPYGGDETRLLADFVHSGEESHRVRGLAEGAALAAVWNRQHEMATPAV